MSEPRRFEMKIDLDATPEEVWRALTDPVELCRWFPLQADVQPGVGGEVRWAWNERFVWTNRIETWNPGRQLRLLQSESLPFDLEGRPLAEGAVPPARIAIEMELEARAGGCRLRLVHSGFGAGAAWDDELDSISHGWQAELRSLRHYLSRHRGRDRHAAWVFRTTGLAPDRALARLTSLDGFAIEVTSIAPGLPWSVRTPWGETWSGVVLVALPTGEIAGTVREHDDALLRLHAWRAGGLSSVGAWLSTWGENDAVAIEFAARAELALAKLFPDAIA
jgi:uncharacterized protein YndB with AHSA1/START domain